MTMCFDTCTSLPAARKGAFQQKRKGMKHVHDGWQINAASFGQLQWQLQCIIDHRQADEGVLCDVDLMHITAKLSYLALTAARPLLLHCETLLHTGRHSPLVQAVC